MTKLMQFVALIAVLGCFLSTTVTAQSWGRVQSCPQGENAVGFQLFFENRQSRRLLAIFLTCTNGRRIISLNPLQDLPAGPTRIPGRTHFCQSGNYLESCQLQLQQTGVQQPGRNMPANNLNCRCNDGQILFGDGHHTGIWQPWSPPCPNGIVGIQIKAGRTPNPYYIHDARFPCSAEEEEEE